MTDPEDPAEKNEQELNLFSDQPQPEEASPGPEPGTDVPQEAETPAAESPAQETPAEPSPAPADAIQPDDSVIAPPPPRKQAASTRPGIVSPRTGRASAFQPSASAPASVQNHKSLPHALQQTQSLGQMLTAIRNARGMALEEVALATRIRMEYLVELENDELMKALPPVYISAYVRKLIEVYDLPKADSDILIDKMHGETPQEQEELPEKLIESVNEGALVNEGENKRIRNITFVFFGVIGLAAAALLWLVILVIVHYVRPSEPVPAPGSGVASGSVPQAEAPVSQTVHIEESELDALIVPETPSISVLKMSKVPGVRESL